MSSVVTARSVASGQAPHTPVRISESHRYGIGVAEGASRDTYEVVDESLTPRRTIQRTSFTHVYWRPLMSFFRGILRDQRTRPIVAMALVGMCGFVFLAYVGHLTDSLAMRAFAYMTWFDILCLLSAIVAGWVAKQQPTLTHTFGYTRVEVICVFASTIALVFSCLFVFKEGVEHTLMPHKIQNPAWLIPAALIGLIFHLIGILSVQRYAQAHQASESTSRSLKRSMESLTYSVCGPGYCLQAILQCSPVNTHILSAFVATAGVVFSAIASDIPGWEQTDSLVAILIAGLILWTLLPISIHHGRILLQTSPEHKSLEIEKILREINTLPDVLNTSEEHFWQQTYNETVCTLHVRVSRDADAQSVAAHVHAIAAKTATACTVQVLKSD